MSKTFLHLNPILYKAIGILEFETESPVSVGAGGAELKRSFLRLPTGEFIIPSSTWKGAFRSLTEKLAKSIQFKGIEGFALKFYHEGVEGISYCGERSDKLMDEFEKQFMEEVIKVLKGGKSNVIPHTPHELSGSMMKLGYEEYEINEVREKGRNARERLAYRLAEDYLAFHCPLGRLYGNRILAGKLRFLDTIFMPKTIETRPGIAIDRKSGKVKEGALYFTEVIPKGMKLKLIMIADNLAPGNTDSKLFASTLNTSKFGLYVGARKTAGLGALKIDEELSHWYVIELEKDKEGLKLGNPFKYGERKTFNEFIKLLYGQDA